MLKNFDRLEDLNFYYTQVINQMAMGAKALCPEVSQEMLNSLMEDRAFYLELLNEKIGLEASINDRLQRSEFKIKKINLRLDLRKNRFDCYQLRKRNRKLYRIYKQLKKEENKQVINEEQEKLNKVKNNKKILCLSNAEDKVNSIALAERVQSSS